VCLHLSAQIQKHSSRLLWHADTFGAPLPKALAELGYSRESLVMSSTKHYRAFLHKIRALGDDRPILSFFVIDTFNLSEGGRALRVRHHL
jgi:hypothetical protein